MRARAAASSSRSRATRRRSCSLALAVHHHQPVEAEVQPGLHQQGGVGHEDAPARRGVGGGAARLLVAHARVHEGVELGARGARPRRRGPRGPCGRRSRPRPGCPGRRPPPRRRRPARPGAIISWATPSRSSVPKPAAARRRRTRDLPQAMPPVRPTLSTPGAQPPARDGAEARRPLRRGRPCCA